MISNSGRPIQVEIKYSFLIRVQGETVRPYMAVRKVKSIKKTVFKSGRRGEAVMLVDQAVFDAIRAYEKNDGYAGMKLAEYLERMFPGDGK